MSKFLEVVGAKTHNLKNISLKIPKNKITVITGLSGSGKSSLAFNTIYSEGQKKYLESLSTYARMFIGGMMDEAQVDEINGLSPTISIDQKTTNNNPRSTVGTITEIYDYYKLLFLHVGKRKCVKCGNSVKKDSMSSIIAEISEFPLDTKFVIKSSIFKDKKASSFAEIKKKVLDMGFIRFAVGADIFTVNDELDTKTLENKDLFIVIDRLVVKDFSSSESSDTKRLKDSLDLAFKTGNAFIEIDFLKEGGIESLSFSNTFVCSHCGHVPEKLDISSFSFNSHNGACPDCHGLGEKVVFLEENIVSPNLTIAEGAIKPWFSSAYYIEVLKEVSKKHKFSLNIPYREYSKKERDLIMHGTGEDTYKVTHNYDGTPKVYNAKYEGVIPNLTRKFFDGEGETTNKLAEYITYMDCPVCNGYRLKQESLSVYIGDLNVGELSSMNVEKSLVFLQNLTLNEGDKKIASKVLKNAIERLEFLSGVGLSYIDVSRKVATLSGGELQRIRLATQIGTKLEGIIYVLDEPSIGLHPRDNDMLIENLKKLRDLGNTLIIVEHDEDIMRNADYIIDIGPGAGIHGGSIVAEGTIEDIINSETSVTGPFLARHKHSLVNNKNRKIDKFLKINGAKENNLKNIDVSIPLQNLVVVTGVSGSGKSSLVNDILADYLANKLNNAYTRQYGKFKSIEGMENLDKVVIIDQSPIGRTPRSNPATYTGVFTHIREVFAMTEESKVRGYDAGRFSFNTKKGRCEACEGDGVKKIEMHFLPAVYVTCEVCEGKRFNGETLQVAYKGKTISDVLNMTVEEALDYFSSHAPIVRILQTLNDVGLSYIKLGQSSTTLSGGESQRIKLATELSKRSTSKTFYILDEPTTGLHFADTEKLIKILHSLVDKGNSVLVIEHNMDVILNADYIVDIGLEGGDKGGNLVFSGKIEELIKDKKSFTGESVRKYLNS
ncbi:MAG: excinuclease ABC subunit UvrA [Candidatus Gracilibacteria bacterium]|nr:excinuclease ABC subunit UvrA [Candidatus Gracilibacteria bacterium]